MYSPAARVGCLNGQIARRMQPEPGFFLVILAHRVFYRHTMCKADFMLAMQSLVDRIFRRAHSDEGSVSLGRVSHV